MRSQLSTNSWGVVGVGLMLQPIAKTTSVARMSCLIARSLSRSANLLERSHPRAMVGRGGALGQYVPDRLAAVGDGDGPAGQVGHGQLGIDAQQMIDRGHQIGRRNWIARRVGSVLVRSAMHVAGLHSAAGQQTEPA